MTIKVNIIDYPQDRRFYPGQGKTIQILDSEDKLLLSVEVEAHQGGDERNGDDIGYIPCLTTKIIK